MDVYDKDHLPVPIEDMPHYRKIGTTPMWFHHGPFRVYTQEGDYTLPEGWRGYIAVDRAGHPYPIAEDEHATTYEKVPF